MMNYPLLDRKVPSGNMQDKCELLANCLVNYLIFFKLYFTEFCKPRKSLVERALLDLQATSGFSQLWEREWERNKKFVEIF
jgi:hypothetical protein